MIHPTAIVDPDAELADGVTVGAYAVIQGRVCIGPATRVYPHAYICGYTTIGRECQIHPNAVVGSDPQDLNFRGERSYCSIGDRTIIREGASVHRSSTPEGVTRIGSDCFIMCQAHVGHDCQIGDRVKITNAALLGGHVVVEDDTFISAHAVVHQFVRIGTLAMIAGSARVTMDVPPYFTCARENTCVSVNTVGMRRTTCMPDEIEDARRAYRTLYRSGLPFQAAIERLGRTFTTHTGRRIYDFVSQPSKRGYAKGVRQRRAPDDDAPPRPSETRQSELPQ